MPTRGSYTEYCSCYIGGIYDIGWSTYGAIRGNRGQNARFALVWWFVARETFGATEGCSCCTSLLLRVSFLCCILFISCLGGDLGPFSLGWSLKMAARRLYFFNRISKVDMPLNFLYWDLLSSVFHLPFSRLFGLKVLYRLGARGPIWPIWETGVTGGIGCLPAKPVWPVVELQATSPSPLQSWLGPAIRAWEPWWWYLEIFCHQRCFLPSLLVTRHYHRRW
jgi:hypothetical protein